MASPDVCRWAVSESEHQSILKQSTCAPNVPIAFKNCEVVASLAVLVVVGPDHILSSRSASDDSREVW